MTSTEFTAGLVEGTRVSSKVLKPPGGGSSDIFGLGNSYSYNGTAEKNQTNDSNTHNRVFGVITPASPASTNLQSKSNIETNISENHVPTKPKKKVFVHRNPITGEEIEICLEEENSNPDKDTNADKNTNADKDNNTNVDKDIKEESTVNESTPFKPVQTSIRVRNPPGGKSSGIF